MFRLTVTDDYFCGFLRHLVREEGFDAELLLEVVEKPWKWSLEFLEWRKADD